jgi:hypothetical protein
MGSPDAAAVSRDAGSTARAAAKAGRAPCVNALSSGACAVGLADVEARQASRLDGAAATLGLGATSAATTGAALSTVGTTVGGAAWAVSRGTGSGGGAARIGSPDPLSGAAREITPELLSSFLGLFQLARPRTAPTAK